MDIYFDESIHDRGKFIVLAAVVASTEEISAATNALRESGFEPGRDEFKSSMTMNGNPQAQAIRERFQEIIGGCKLAIGVCAINERDQLMSLAGQLSQSLVEGEGQRVLYLDQGMKRQAIALPPDYDMKTDCDSRTVIGIQLADCCAHVVGTILLGELGLVTKMLPADPANTGYDFDLELAWTLWASIRFALASSEPQGVVEEDGYYEPAMKPYGLLISDGCDDSVARAAQHRFGTAWVGCIH